MKTPPIHLPQMQSQPTWGIVVPHDSTIELARRLMGLRALAMSLDGLFHISGEDDREYRSTLVATGEAVHRLELARQAANTLKLPLRIFACTEARAAMAVTTDADSRDRKFLTGSKTSEDHHVYCGSVDAAVSRALVYAQYADVVCFRSVNADLSEAARFAAALRASFPAKQMGYAHAPALTGVRWDELDHRYFEARLREYGYDFYIVTQFGQTIFPHARVPGAWVSRAPARSSLPLIA